MIIPRIVRKYLKKREITNFYRQFVQPGDLCFDIGANMGERTDCLLKTGASVIAVEPQKSCFTRLEQKYQKNQKVRVLPYAVGSKEGTGELMICDESTECSSLSTEFVTAYTREAQFKWSRREKITITTLEKLCIQFGIPVFCKIDVEGYESEVFAGLKEPIRFICFEFNKPLLNDTLKSLEILSRLGNYQCNYITYENMKLVLKNWLPLDEFKDGLANIIPSDVLTGEMIIRLTDKEQQ